MRAVWRQQVRQMANRYFKKLRLRVGFLGLALGLMLISQSVQAVPKGGYAHPEILIQPEELKVLIDKKDPNIRIIDLRPNLQYIAGHVPGGVQVWRPDVEDKKHPLPGMMAPQAQIEELMGNLGISNKNTLVIYSDGPDNGRLWWVLAYYGFPLKQMKLLDGGIDGWKAKGNPVEMTPPRVEKARFEFPEKAGRVTPLLCTLTEVKSALSNPKRVVLDVRSKKEYLGEETKEGAAKAGRIPGVTWIEWKEAIVEDGPYKGYWRSAEEIKKIFSAKGVTPNKDIYIY
jgi:thiosulfate/3-mercaptopyruvate sulfurtransferase